GRCAALPGPGGAGRRGPESTSAAGASSGRAVQQQVFGSIFSTAGAVVEQLAAVEESPRTGQEDEQIPAGGLHIFGRYGRRDSVESEKSGDGQFRRAVVRSAAQAGGVEFDPPQSRLHRFDGRRRGRAVCRPRRRPVQRELGRSVGGNVEAHSTEIPGAGKAA
ncbi:conserved hypothetical protein, partial [Trichinella spiralis]|uniref:hypothetical protein n=1 Tax=Trichinella spiralis TaxID=6334 RepID=UPI0001EFD67F